MTEEKFDYICNLRSELRQLKALLDEIKNILDLPAEDNSYVCRVIDPTNRFTNMAIRNDILSSTDVLNIYYDRVLALYESKKKDYEEL